MKSTLMFDLDGTLIDSVPDLAFATNAMLQDLQKPTYDEAFIRHWVGNGAKMLVARALSGQADVDPNLTTAQIDDALSRFFYHYENNTCVYTKAYPGVHQGLAQLKQQGYELVLITNKPSQFIPAILDKMGWQALFSLTLGGDSLAVKKPHPEPLLYACQQLKVLPEQCYMIGDSSNDVLAGQNAKIETLALTYGYNYGQDIRLSHPTHVFDEFLHLVQFLIRD